jgi:hypothetical protein
MGIYHWYELGVWFDSQLSVQDIQRLLPKNADVRIPKDSSSFFVPCFRGNDSQLKGFDGQVSEDEKKKLLLLWRHIQQTEGLQAKRIACRYHCASTYEADTKILDIPITNIEYDVKD